MSMIIRNAVKAAVLAASVLPIAAMAADLYGGGATFPAVPYVGTDYQAINTRLSSSLGTADSATINASSIFGSFIAATGNNMQYCQTGSGTGKSLLTTTTTPATGACGYFSGSPAGFSAPAVQPAYPNYIGTDSPIAASDYSNFLGSAGVASTHTSLVQVPSIVGAVTLPMKLTATDGTAVTHLDLSTQEVCQIFSGAVTTWSDLRSELPATAITVVYRSDNSGTSFAFTNFLARNCNDTTSAPTGITFTTNQTYSAAINGSVSGTAVTYAGFQAVSGNLNVVSTVNLTEGAIGYADPGDVVNVGVDYAFVDSNDPLDLTSPSYTGANLLIDTVINGVNSATGLPATAAAPSTGVTGGLTLINPSVVISGTYPILAPTYLAFYSAGNGADNAVALQNLVKFVHNLSGTPGTRPSFPARSGYAYITAGNVVFTTRINTAVSKIGQ